MKAVTIILAASIFHMNLAQAEESFPPDVQSAVDKRTSAISKIDTIYLQDLAKLKVAYTKKGDLQTANMIVSLIEKVKVEAAPTKESVESFLDGEWYYSFGKKVYPRSFKNGQLITEKGKRLPWSLKGRVATIDWMDGGFEFLTIDLSQPNMIHGRSSSGTQLTYTRKEKNSK